MTPEQYEALFGAEPNSPQPATAVPDVLPAVSAPVQQVQATPVPPSPQVQATPAPPSPQVPGPPVQVAIQNNIQVETRPGRSDVAPFHFNGGAATYFGTGLLGLAITVFTLGICYPFAVVLRQRWQAKHTFIEGRRLMLTGSAIGLFGNWLKWLLLMIVTLGIYSFWVIPRIVKWKTENLAFDPTHGIQP